jgi:lysophospholipase L1-like esterase
MKLKFDRGGCLLALFSLFFVVFLVEIGLRLLKPPVTFKNSGPCLVVRDNRFGYRYRPNSSGRFQHYNEIDNWIVINSLGFHDIEHDLTANDGRILALGDSFTAASQVSVAEGWTQIVQQQLSDTAVINLGVDGYGTDRQLQLLEYYAPILQPDVVILAFFENDVKDILASTILDCFDDHLIAYQTETQKQQLVTFLNDNKPTRMAYWLAEHSYFYRAVALLTTKNGILLSQQSLGPKHIGVSPEPLPDLPPNLMPELFTRFDALAEKYDFQIFVVPIPGKDDPRASLTVLEQSLDGKEWPHITIIDVYPAMEEQYRAEGYERSDLYFVYDGHFNQYGYAFFGQAVAAALNKGFLSEP